MHVIFSPTAQDELDDATLFLEGRKTGLGEQFRHEVHRSAEQIVRSPLLWPLFFKEVRRCLLKRFPYALLYAVEADVIYVIAIAHQHRKPGYWTTRLPH